MRSLVVPVPTAQTETVPQSRMSIHVLGSYEIWPRSEEIFNGKEICSHWTAESPTGMMICSLEGLSLQVRVRPATRIFRWQGSEDRGKLALYAETPYHPISRECSILR